MNRLTIERTFRVPVETIWRMLTEREHIAKWWGPRGWELQIHRFEVEPGGHFFYMMKSDLGQMYGLWVFDRVQPTTELDYLSSFADAEGAVAAAPFSELFPLQCKNELRLSAEGDGTRLVLVSFPHEATGDQEAFFAGMHTSMQGGYHSTLDGLEELMAGGTELHLSRFFPVPAEQVFRAWTDPAAMQRWSCPQGFKITEDTGITDAGDVWRTTMRSEERGEHTCGGKVLEVVPGAKLEFTHSWEGAAMAGPVTTCTVEFRDIEGGSIMLFRQTGFDRVEALEGRRGGWSESFDKLGEYLS